MDPNVPRSPRDSMTWGGHTSWREVPGPASWPGVVLEASRARQRKTVSRHGEVVLKSDELREHGLYVFAPELPDAPLISLDAFREHPRLSVLVRPVAHGAHRIGEACDTVVQLNGVPWELCAAVEPPTETLGPATWARSAELELAGAVAVVRCVVTVAGHGLEAPPTRWSMATVPDLAARRRELFGFA